MVSHCATLQVITLLITCSLFVQHFVVFAASRPLKMRSPGVSISGEQKALQGFVVNRFRKMEDAFRPTSPGHSPGIGHPP
ncbi:hypothetical protein DCAR_0833037 [Daucus carota subsp. sativus]|uniref:Uncharacterized protein n=1 Tax=Daucus carota subsp. sativus TaxID=79200 RepID=A0AAF0XUD5_DAUCS|nr:hypothetical protein DCAR_0833037 [Daucus carota subsp. sativus]